MDMYDPNYEDEYPICPLCSSIILPEDATGGFDNILCHWLCSFDYGDM